MKNELRDSLQEARCKTGLSRTEVAKTIGVVKNTITQWENGKTTPSAERLKVLVSLYKLNIVEISCLYNIIKERREKEKEVMKNIRKKFPKNENKVYVEIVDLPRISGAFPEDFD